jgi:thiol-disulfide isomerase/thioredoxin
MRFGVFAVVVLLAALLPARQQTDHPHSPGFTVRHTPDAVAGECVHDSTNGVDLYRWIFRTDVHNATGSPLRVTSFDGYYLFAGEWVSLNQNAPGFTNQQFVEWYTKGDTLADGWIPPGATASDASNWVRFYTPEPPRCKWVYAAEDTAGNAVYAESEVELVPYFEKREHWSGVDPSRLVTVSVRARTPAGAPSYAQLRLSRVRDRSHQLYDVAAAAEAEEPLSVRAAAPGLYRLALYCGGYDALSIPLLLDKGGADVSVEATLTPHTIDGKSPDRPGVSFDDAHAYLETILGIDREAQAAQDAFSAIAREHAKNHDDTPIDFDWSPTVEMLERHLASNDTRVQTYAAWRFCTLSLGPSDADSTTVEGVASLLPPDSPCWAAMSDLVGSLQFKYEDVFGAAFLKRVADENPDRVVRAVALSQLALRAKASGDVENSLLYNDELTTNYADVKEITGALLMLSMGRNVKPGTAVPDFDVTTLDGEEVTNASLRGKFYLLDFWATWCAPCRGEMKYLHDTYKKHKDDNFTIVSVSLDRKMDDVESYRNEKWPMPWRNAFVEGKVKDDLTERFEVFAVPRLLLVDPDGMIVEAGAPLRGEKLESTVAAHLKGG